MENGDEWLARDKLYHVLFCFFIALVSSILTSRTRYPFLRRRSVGVGSVVSLAAGAAKEIADEFGFFKSAGASAKDAVADVLGILVAVVTLSVWKSISAGFRCNRSDQVRGIEIV